MATFFRPSLRASFFRSGYRFRPSSTPIKTVVATAAGVATVSGVGRAVAIATGTTAGVATVTGVGRAIKTATFSIAGAATTAGVGATLRPAAGVSAGVATVTGVAIRRQVISTNMLQKPVNCVLAGEQITFKGGRARGRQLTHAFGE